MIRVTHLTAGALITVGYIDFTHPNIQLSVFYISAGLIGSVLPDIDYFLGRNNTIFRHRGITHTLLFLILCAIGMYYFKVNLGIITLFALTFLSHLCLDSLTMVGIPFFWPLTKKGYCLHLMRTGSLSEYSLVLFPLVIATIILIYITSQFMAGI